MYECQPNEQLSPAASLGDRPTVTTSRAESRLTSILSLLNAPRYTAAALLVPWGTPHTSCAEKQLGGMPQLGEADSDSTTSMPGKLDHW